MWVTLIALSDPLKSMLCEETSVHTGLSCARIVFTFCKFWMSQTCMCTWTHTHKQNLASNVIWHYYCENESSKRCVCVRLTYNDGAICWATVQLIPAWEREWEESVRGKKRKFIMNSHVNSYFKDKERERESDVCTLVSHRLTPEYTALTQCHRGPPEFSGTCMWCRCPKP